MLNTMFVNDVQQTLDQFRRSVDQMFDNFYGHQTTPAVTNRSGEHTWSFSPVLEHGWTENHLNLRAILPGVSESDVRVTIQNNQLVVEGEHKTPAGFENSPYTQMPYGKFWTAVTLPSGLDLEKVNCRLHSGVLDIQIPVAETSKPKQIQIQTGESRNAISA